MPANDLPLLIDAARAAGEIAMRHWKGDHQTWEKDNDQGPVTEADLEVDAMLHARLTQARPDYGWLSEETEDTDARLSRERVFIIDPIDGTRAFVAGDGSWAHALAVVENGQVTAACVYLPALDKLYSAALGGGAHLNEAQISTSGRTALDGASILTARPTMDPLNWPGGVPQVDRRFRSSLAYRLSLVAEGRFDAMVTLRDSWEWDIAAGCLIAAEAGAGVSDRNGARMTFNSPSGQTEGALCATSALHPQFLERLLGQAAP